MALDASALEAVEAEATEAMAAQLDAGSASTRQWCGNGASAAMMLPAGVPVVLWGDEGRMKQELVAWAKAVASMAIRESMQR
ncbi:hypothetical protein ACP70R_009742 [Stipagrostis hirtigluma subsp. patula]